MNLDLKRTFLTKRFFFGAMLLGLGCILGRPIHAQPKKPGTKKETVTRLYTPEERSRYTTAFLEATLKEAQGYPDEALDGYRKLVESDPAFHAAHYRIACILFERKEYAAALAAIQKALLYDPRNVWYWRLSAQAHAGAGKIAEAVADWERVVKMTRHPEDRIELALLYLKMDKTTAAAAQADSLGFLGARIRGLALVKQKKYDAACKELAAHVAMFPDDTAAYYDLAEAYTAAGKETEGQKTWRLILERNPNDEKAAAALGRRAGAADLSLMSDPSVPPGVKVKKILEKAATGERETAVLWARAALNVHPGAEGLAGALASAFVALGKTDSARKYFALETRNAPGARSAWNELLRADSVLKDFAALSEHAEAFVELFPEDPSGRAMLGMALVETGRHAEAVPHLERALKFVPDNLSALEALVLAHLKIGTADKGPTLSPAYSVAKVYAEFRHGKPAETCLQALPERDEPYVHWTRGRILLTTERRQEGLEAIGKAADRDVRYAEAAGDLFQAAGDAVNAARYWNAAKAAGSKSAAAKLHP